MYHIVMDLTEETIFFFLIFFFLNFFFQTFVSKKLFPLIIVRKKTFQKMSQQNSEKRKNFLLIDRGSVLFIINGYNTRPLKGQTKKWYKSVTLCRSGCTAVNISASN